MKPIPKHLLLRPSTPLRPTPSAPPSRAFVTNALTPLQTLSATRILPHRAPPLYNIIADIAAYPSFIPYCTASAITSLSAPDAAYRKQWPRTADLRIGYGPYDELFRSAVYCVPYSVLEAVGGDAAPTIARGQLGHYYGDGDGDAGEKAAAGNRSLFTSLLTRWTFREFPFKPAPPDGQAAREASASAPSRPRTEVSLVLEVRFASAVYSALSQAVAPRVAGVMIEAFEKRATAVLGPESGAEEDASERSAMEGVTRGADTIK